MSNIVKMTANEQLFTELTPEEGAVIEGGATLTLHSVYAHNPQKLEALHLTFNGKTIFSNSEITESVDFQGWGLLKFYDDDNWSRDYLGDMPISDRPGSVRTQLGGSGYRYILHYSVR
jgi:hypothetical protein